MKLKFSLCVLLCAAKSVSVAETVPRITGFFTNMRYVQESGDVVGDEIWITVAKGGYWATVAEDFNPPVVVPVQVSGSKVHFCLTTPRCDPADHLVVNFDGEVIKNALVGLRGSEHVVLKRVPGVR